jgi:hypothetical protein
MFHTKAVEKIKTHILCSVTNPPSPRRPQNRAVFEIKKNILEASLATDDNMGNAHCMLDT